MKCFCIWAITAVISFSAYSQSDFDRYSREQKNDFENYKKERQSDFLSYRKKRNAEFADYLAKRWEYFDVVAGRKKTLRPEPPAPIVKKVNEPTSPVRLPDVQIEEIPPVVQPKPVDYPVVLPLPGQPQVEVEFYGMRCTIPSVALQGFELLGLKEEQIARAWKRISSGECDALVSCCNRYGRQMNLCDWGYVELSGRMARACLSSGNEAVLLQTYLLTQLGYDARLLRRGNTLTMMIPCSGTLYGYASLNVAGRTYYVLDKTIAGGGKVETYRKNFSEADRVIDLSIRRELNFAERPVPEKRFVSKRYPDMEISVATNENLIDFYAAYPHCENRVYAQAALSGTAKKAIESFRPKLAGKDEIEAAGLLLNFVQTAFEYKTDGDQFGYEKPFFVDELFYYPYSDCEDRAVLYACLVRELLGLEAVLLDYPRHIATAVCFGRPVEGDYVELNGKRYVVCDPTYINASIGQSMPMYKQERATVIVIAGN